MSEFNGILDIIENDNINTVTQKSIHDPIKKSEINEAAKVIDIDIDNIPQGKPFDIKEFSRELYNKSKSKNKAYMELASNISGHDVAHNCILSIVNKLLGVPIENYADKWLPIFMRSSIGSAIHDFIQNNSSQFTENEPSIKVPSIRFSGRIDCLIGNNVLVEIKSCTYKDYEKIIKTQRPRAADFYQAMTYKYILENHLEELQNPEIETRSPKPKLSKYNIEQIQFIYIAHDIVAADAEDLGQAMTIIDSVKKTLNAKSDAFHFMKSLTLDVSTFDTKPYMDFIETKIKCINWYLDNNKIPSIDDPFINKKACFFCLYSSNCPAK